MNWRESFIERRLKNEEEKSLIDDGCQDLDPDLQEPVAADAIEISGIHGRGADRRLEEDEDVENATEDQVLETV